MKLCEENPGVVSDSLYALSRGPAKRVQTASSCNHDGIPYNTYEREKNLKTQNSGITTKGDHLTAKMKKTEEYDHYGRIQEVIELNYNDKSGDRSVVLFKCYWYDQDPKKKRGPKDDGNFISINTTAQWYKEDPYILVTQASKVIFLNDRDNDGWQYVQKFEARSNYDVNEYDEPVIIDIAHQDDPSGCKATKLAEVDENFMARGGPAHDGQVDFTVEVSVVDKDRNKLVLPDEFQDMDDEWQGEEDPTQSEYVDLECGGAESDDGDDD